MVLKSSLHPAPYPLFTLALCSHWILLLLLTSIMTHVVMRLWEQWTREKTAYLKGWVLRRHGELTRDWRVTTQDPLHYWG